ncbi:sulfurtransferase DndC [Desulfatibacillum aliphaticivorans]|uniref:Sulfurtransferase DndC n=1 Tax=Desulfatibacillum aliphaticivorans TaxID=218208 RepID=B8FD44_DESAL|nr:DNA phosphorothioation system sulfurtransferase DndC [Desulfatibacillum aliphaticivorans]ACL06475.1 sulfurtransferase DndC [Desulfatibacillum aliphaticivorans]
MKNDKEVVLGESFDDSAFEELGFNSIIGQINEEIQSIYLADEIPWVIGYSGGKDSTAILQLVWHAIGLLPPQKRIKPIHVISTDTLVENPIVAQWVDSSLSKMRIAAKNQNLPIRPNKLRPRVEDTFWVHLIGRGYPSPRPWFRWCTDRLKIWPSNNFINSLVKNYGEAILVLGSRKAESSRRAHVMKTLEKKRIREKLSPNTHLPNSYVYTPIENWSNDDVWLYLDNIENPWLGTNKELFDLYKGATEQGECPFVTNSTSPSCGNSRFGCWVCTLVAEDKSMTAMIQNDEDKEWLMPLLKIRNEIAVKEDRHLRDYRRMNGAVQIFKGRTIAGPYKQSFREDLLRRLLEAQLWVRENGPESVSDIELVSLEELREIRRIWLTDKHEIEDSLPRIYESVMNLPFKEGRSTNNSIFRDKEINLLRDLCNGDELHFSLIRELLDIEQGYRSTVRRAGLYEKIEKAFSKHIYRDEEDATDRALRQREAIKLAEEGHYENKSKEDYDFNKDR